MKPLSERVADGAFREGPRTKSEYTADGFLAREIAELEAKLAEVEKCLAGCKFSLSAVKEHRSKLRERLAEAEKLHELAEDYISKSPCDPDITDEQSKAWVAYRDAIAQREGRE